jgi:hypothetical protein
VRGHLFFEDLFDDGFNTFTNTSFNILVDSCSKFSSGHLHSPRLTHNFTDVIQLKRHSYGARRSLPPLASQHKPLVSVNPMQPFMIDQHPVTFEQHTQPAVAEPWALSCQRFQLLSDRRIIWPP